MLKNLKSKTTKTISLILVFLLSITVTAFAKTSSPSLSYSYVALGDSLAAGQTPYGVENGYGYTNIIQDALDLAGVSGGFHNFGVSGNTSEDVLNQITLGKPEYSSVLVKRLSVADIVTIDVGADDLLPAIKAYFENPNTDNYNVISSKMGEVPINIYKIIYTINQINPDARIYVMGYYDALIRYLDPIQHQQFLGMLSIFNSSIEAVVTDPTSVPSPVPPYHLLPYPGTAPEYVRTFEVMYGRLDYLPVDIHPSIEGYQVIANVFWAKIQDDL